jgi:formylglycine-generating enzyme required for sulfatase activity
VAKRTKIPKAVRDKVLVDAMHRCCLCPEHHDIVDLHHVVQISEGGPNTEDNLMAICPTCHAKIHRIRNHYTLEQLRMYKERWVQLCAQGLPLDVRIARAFDTTRPPQPTQIPTERLALRGSYTSAGGIPSETFQQVCQILLDCEPFRDDDHLRAVFAHPKLKPFRHGVPQASTLATRVDGVIAFLIEKRRADTKENALVLLLRALSEQLDPVDERHSRLVELAANLEQLHEEFPDDEEVEAALDKARTRKARQVFFLGLGVLAALIFLIGVVVIIVWLARPTKITVALKTHHGRYVTAMNDEDDRDWEIRAETSTLGNWEKFTLLCLDDGKAAFQTYHGRYVTAMNDEEGRDWELGAETSTLGNWETFTLVEPETEKRLRCSEVLRSLRQGDVGIALMTYHGRYVTATNDEDDRDWMLKAETSTLGSWEKFVVEPLSSSVPTSQPTLADAPTLSPAPQPKSTASITVKYVPAGAFLRGSDTGTLPFEDDETPQREIYLDAFWIHHTEVTNAQYKRFVDASGYDEPRHWSEDGWDWRQGANPGDESWGRSLRTWPRDWQDGLFSVGRADHPVVGINWYEADAYCHWLAEDTGSPYHLPTEAEWEKAARGVDGRIYPWGNDWDPAHANCALGGPSQIVPVGQYSPSGDSFYGVADMAGNVYEWVADWYDGGYYEGSPDSNPPGPESSSGGAWVNHRVMRGGSWRTTPEFTRTPQRHSMVASYASDDVGFRCAYSASEP